MNTSTILLTFSQLAEEIRRGLKRTQAVSFPTRGIEDTLRKLSDLAKCPLSLRQFAAKFNFTVKFSDYEREVSFLPQRRQQSEALARPSAPNEVSFVGM